MGTRGSCGFIRNGIEKIQYNQYDSYPTGLGLVVMRFIHHNQNTVESMIELFDRIKLVTDDIPPTEEEMDFLLENEAGDSSVNFGGGWYSKLRNLQGDFEALKKVPYIEDSKNFLLDSLFCEWAYIINLDTEKLELYKGFNMEKLNNAGRYACREGVEERTPKYYGVKLIGELDVSRIKSMAEEEISTYLEKLEED